MKREQLEKLELNKEQVDAVMKMYGEDVNALKADHEKALEAAGGDTKTLTEQLEAANKQIEAMSKLDAEGLQKAANEWKGKAEKAAEELKAAQKQREDDIFKIKMDHDLQDALKAAKVRNPKTVNDLLNMEMLEKGYDPKERKFIGLDDQLKAIQESDAYLFETDETLPTFVSTTNGKLPKGDKMTRDARVAMGLDPEPKN